MKGLFRDDLKRAVVVPVGDKFGIEAEYNNGEKELLRHPFETAADAQREIDETLKAKNS